jgi:myo-inositol 2-dehydrogenase/D-chiro-inositol 1-dehydrogenase
VTVRVGVIGAGIMGADHSRNLAGTVSGAAVSLVADLDAGRAAQAAEAAGARSTADPKLLINDPDVDAVVIASHDSTHAGLLLACPEAGKPGLCQKPLAPTVDRDFVSGGVARSCPVVTSQSVRRPACPAFPPCRA